MKELNEDQKKTPPKRSMPQSELDFHLMTTDGLWGDQRVSPGLQEKLRELKIQEDKEGHPIFDEKGDTYVSSESLWELLGFYTRDMRLANLSAMHGEVHYCQYFLNLANDFLQANETKAFLICLSRVATMLELSQSKGGFLRRQMNTLTQKLIKNLQPPPKKKLFGNNKGGGEYSGGEF